MLTADLGRAGVAAGCLVLDLGCGGGRHAFGCLRAGARVVAVDTNPGEVAQAAGMLAAMDEAGEAGAGGGWAGLTGDAARLPFADASFDVVIASEVLEHIADDEAALAELARVLRPGGCIAVTVPRFGPEVLNWALSSSYHNVEGGHIRIYRRRQLRRRLASAGITATGSHHAHGLHSPYWWLRCLVGVERDSHPLVAAYHRLLVWDIEHRPLLTRALERALDPFIGKSLVLYGTRREASRPVPPRPARPGQAPPLAARALAAPAPTARPAGPPAPSPARADRALSVVFSAARLSSGESAATLDAIAAVQRHDGLIPWSPTTRADPWNHLEAAMALAAGGRAAEAERAWHWLLANERPGGGWHAELAPDGSPTAARVDTNCVAYIGAALWHHYLVSGDQAVLSELLPVLERAVSLVLACQRPGGEIAWEIDASGRLGSYALLAASSSIHHALVSASSCAGVLGLERPEWSAAAERLAFAVGERCNGRRAGAFADKSEFAMDWYYPVLTGALGAGSASRLERGRRRFVVEGAGVRCRSDQHWVTTAETAECALAFGRLGDLEQAAALLQATRAHRQADGSYVTGLVHPERQEFPPGERTTYSAAAVLLADDALGGGPTAELFSWKGARRAAPHSTGAQPAAAGPAGARPAGADAGDLAELGGSLSVPAAP